MGENQENHTLTVENLKRVTATEVQSVDSFSDRQMVLSYLGGRIVVQGSGMKIVNFSKSTGAFTATGDIISVRYMQKGLNLRQKLFK